MEYTAQELLSLLKESGLSVIKSYAKKNTHGHPYGPIKNQFYNLAGNFMLHFPAIWRTVLHSRRRILGSKRVTTDCARDYTVKEMSMNQMGLLNCDVIMLVATKLYGREFDD